MKNLSIHSEQEHNKYLTGFVLLNIGQIEAYKNNKAMLEEIIARRT